MLCDQGICLCLCQFPIKHQLIQTCQVFRRFFLMAFFGDVFKHRTHLIFTASKGRSEGAHQSGVTGLFWNLGGHKTRTSGRNTEKGQKACSKKLSLSLHTSMEKKE